MMRFAILGRAGVWGGLAVLALGIVALVAWGRPGAHGDSSAIAPAAGLAASAPPLDEQVPAGLQTATFSLG